ncbi:unnamed protein product [Orchesella dallaii]|uniref:Uncharacterized protein n=1 Tax=Orchesella dallaii TaxID=48710 RepID=A0ABP1PV67_9HEXA
MDNIPSVFPPWRKLWLNPHSPTTQQYPFGQLLVSLAEEVENEARKYGRDWRLQETDRENLLDVSTEVSQFLVQTGNAVIEKLPTVTFLFDGIPMQHRATGQYLLGVADSITDKSQTFCNPQQPLHYKLRIKIRQILLSAADIFETAGRALMNPENPSDLSKKSEDSTASASRRRRLRSPVRRTVEKMKEDYGVTVLRCDSDENDTDSIAVTHTPPLALVDLSKKLQDSIASASRLRPPFRRTVEKMKEDYGVPNSAKDDTDSIAVTPTPPIVLVLTKTSRGTWRGRGSGRPSRAKKPRKPSHTVEDNDEGDQNSKLANVRK